MNWSIGIRKRDKVALALGFIFLVIVLANWFVNYSMKQVSHHFKSVYEDRLVPALDISAIVERSYKNHLLLEEHILTDDTTEKEKLSGDISQNQKQIDSILVKFEGTYLTIDERQSLENYKKARQNLLTVQNAILSQSGNLNTVAAKKSFNTAGNASFQLLLNPLHDLSKIQGTIGHELLNSAERQMNFIKLLTTLVIAMAVIIALLVATLLQTSRKLNSIKQQNFRLN
ncbi:MCP four helix bundle domain-containing protein [Pontibacter cellulosilyticus]|uniref:MCP four helix bundle domain-containing protein n=1 Tax=Pontibacter cellulosilyticus TaxID=1720253 RepID=A0A923N3P6_9BACT|nr:MCP four helix bundle domain-containing protein [Pontibacter cellulosilyticus]MBC5991668.1 MCP four helix bundle domain-containing protein [Pontibacter cellulosilyticus]